MPLLGSWRPIRGVVPLSQRSRSRRQVPSSWARADFILCPATTSLRLLLPDVGKVRRMPWFRYTGPLRDVDCVAGVLDMEIRECLFRSREEARDMAEALESGFVDLVVGGTYVRFLGAP